MKNNYLKLIFVLFISFVLCSEKEKYSLIPEKADFYVGFKEKYRHSEELSFDLPGRGRIRLTNNFISAREWLDVENGMTSLKMLRIEIDATTWIGSIPEKPFDYLAMDGAPCLIYIGKDGWPDHVKPLNPEKDDFLQAIFESAYLDNTNFTNIYYPFGGDAINLSIGDVWSSRVDSVRRFMNSDSPESITWANTTHTLKKIKHRKGKKIAIVKSITDIRMDLNIILHIVGERLFLTGEVQGTSEVTTKIYLEPLQLFSSKENINLEGEVEMDGEKFRLKITSRSFVNLVD